MVSSFRPLTFKDVTDWLEVLDRDLFPPVVDEVSLVVTEKVTEIPEANHRLHP